jgi:valyl-tRNA synthetase
MPYFGSDATRQWAAQGSLGDDYPFEYTWINLQTKQPVSEEYIKKERQKLPRDKFDKKYGRIFEQLIGASRFLTKIWNAYRFLSLNLDKVEVSDISMNTEELSAIDAYIFLEFNKSLDFITKSFNQYNWHDGFTLLRPFFWNDICDDYIEAIKYKFYSKDQKTRESGLINALNLFYKILTIFAIIMPFISEEIYFLVFKKLKKLKSVHLEKWPTPYENISEDSAEKGKLIIEIIKNLRNIKSKFQIPLNKEISRLIIVSEDNKKEIIEEFKEDIINTIRIKNLEVYNKNQDKKVKDKPDLKEKVEGLAITFYISND